MVCVLHQPKPLYAIKLIKIYMKIKTISIHDEHQDWIERESINLSRFVQKKIDEAIRRRNDSQL